ncbi:hypothetical protein CICLE_v10012136mg [Citrus x clementina]|uniref:UDP-glycosyltransferases domain-containing protein n=1 Tax=Citrus clementina TaxID=85681 RepID=V4SUU0_CITCL|nr:hypothetical protein CICLE_v10012136mg [Citrus x clementina]
MQRPHAPAQGHVLPLLELPQCLIKHSFRITFVNTEYNHKRVIDASGQKNSIGDQIKLVSIPDRMEHEEDRNDWLEELIEEINRQEDEKISCVIADGAMGWAMLHIWPAAAGLLALSFSIPKLLDDGIIDNDGTAIKKHMIQLAPTMATIHSTNLVWTCVGLNTCLKWFGQQQPNSVIYIAFGSFTVFDRILFQEPDMTDNSNDNAYQKGFQDGVGTRGQMVGCTPQQKFLSHPSIACFLRHCGWNPTTEGVSNGLAFLCWPYFAEQFLNESYICAIRKVGQREEINNKVDQMLGDENFKACALELKEKVLNCVREDGQSNKTLNQEFHRVDQSRDYWLR